MRRLLAAVALCMLLAPCAQAATVRVGLHDPDDFRPDVGPFTRMSFEAAPGERNRLVVSPGPRAGAVRFVDRGARLHAGRRCESRGRHVAVCRFDPGALERFFRTRLGDAGDTYRSSARTFVFYEVHGGRGDDRLTGGPRNDGLSGEGGADRIRGGGGSDRLEGGRGPDRVRGDGGADVVADGPGRDTVSGGPGDDVLSSRDTDAPVSDAFDGGPGRDIVSYSSRRAPVVGTAGASAGVAGEHDRLRSVEGLRGGGGNDVLRGTRGADDLNGGSGSDRIYGGAGDDRLAPGSGHHDRVHAGPGDDRIRPGGFYAHPSADIHCGPGRDTVATGDAGMLLRPDCERVTFGRGKTIPAQPVRVSADAVVVDVPCANPDRPRFRQVRLITPTRASPFARAPFNATVAEGERRFDSGPLAVCRVSLTRSGDRQRQPVRLVFRYSPNWMFMLPGAA